MPSIDSAELSTFTEETLLAVDTPADVARTVADALVEADLHGHHSHGVRLLGTYVERIRKGTIDPTGRPEVVRETSTSMIVDGRSGFGQYVGQETIEKAIPKAAESRRKRNLDRRYPERDASGLYRHLGATNRRREPRVPRVRL